MESYDDKIKAALRNTVILRAPKQSLYTFGTTNLHYYIVTEPVYSDIVKDVTETVVREGRVIAEKPKIVTPYYLSMLEGFSSEAKQYFQALIQEYGKDAPGLVYTYKNEPKGPTIVSDSIPAVVDRLNADIDKRGDPLSAIIRGEDALWDVSLMKFIFEVTRDSVQNNVSQLGAKGLLNIDASGVPADARIKIDELFKKVQQGDYEPGELKKELDRWGLFEEYQDRFFRLFKRK